jgi:hypothetical protein
MELQAMQPNCWIVFQCVQIGLQAVNQTMGPIFPLCWGKWLPRQPNKMASSAQSSYETQSVFYFPGAVVPKSGPGSQTRP